MEAHIDAPDTIPDTCWPKAANLAPSDSQSPASVVVCGTDRLAPFPIIENILHDWFELIHSVAPIFHRGTFLSRLAAGEAAQDCQFSALVISICGATISSLKRKSSIDYGGLTAERCLEVAEQIQLQIGNNLALWNGVRPNTISGHR
jgi:hypothetical protein